MLFSRRSNSFSGQRGDCRRGWRAVFRDQDSAVGILQQLEVFAEPAGGILQQARCRGPQEQVNFQIGKLCQTGGHAGGFQIAVIGTFTFRDDDQDGFHGLKKSGRRLYAK